MTAIWMLYATAVAALISCAALLAERGARALRRPARWFWAIALVGSLTVPVLGSWIRAAATENGGARPAPELVGAELLAGSLGETELAASRSEPTLAGRIGGRIAGRAVAIAAVADAPLLALWALSSLAILCTIALAWARLARARRAWLVAVVDDQFVRVSDDTGPAVVGLAPSEIVLPAWALELPPECRAMLLAHEREHIRAGDPILLYSALLALVLAPWNAAIWWQLRRLRLAVEMDCDARVLGRCSDVRAYGALLLEVGRRTVRAPLAAAAFSEPATHLERRLTMMLSRPPRWRVLRALTLGLAGLALAIVACDMQAPVGPLPEKEVSIAELGANGKSHNVRGGVDGERMAAAVAEFFPELLSSNASFFTEVPGTARDTVWTLLFVQDGNGKIVQAYKRAAPHEWVVLERQAAERASAVSRLALRQRDPAAEASADFVEIREEPQSEREVAVRRELTAERAALERQQVVERARLEAAVDRQPVMERPVERPRWDASLITLVPSRKLGGRMSIISEIVDPDQIESVQVIKGSSAPPAASGGIIWISLKRRVSF